MKDLSRWDLHDYLSIPWKRRWYLLTTILLVLAGAAVIAWLRPNMYRSEARILVESATMLDENLSPNAAQARAEERMNGLRQKLESRTFLQRLAERVQLRAASSSLLEEDEIEHVRNYLEVSKSPGNVFTVAYVADSARAAQEVTSTLVDMLIQENQNNLKEMATGKKDFMNDELALAQRELDIIDQKIAQFKKVNLGALPEQTVANMNLLSGLNNQLVAVENTLDRLQDQKKAIEFRIQEQRRMIELARSLAPGEESARSEMRSPAALSPTASLLATKRAQLSETAARYTDRHPDVIRLKKEVEDLERQLKETETSAADDKVVAAPVAPNSPASSGGAGSGTDKNLSQVEFSAEAEIARAKNESDILGKNIGRKEKERADLIRDIDIYKRRLNLAPALEQELTALMRDHETQQKLVETLKTRQFNANIAASATNFEQNDTYKLLDEATLPKHPIFPTRLHILLIGLALSLAAGYGAALGREVMEPSLSNDDEASALFKIPVLASIPEVTRLSKR